MKRAVLFDVGDTLILGHPKYWLWPLLEKRGLVEKADVSRLRQATTDAYAHYSENHMAATDIDSALKFWGQFHRELLRGIGLGDHAEEIAGYLRDNWETAHVWPLTPHAKEVLRTLKDRGYKLGVVSNWDWTLPGVLKATGLDEYFDYVAASALLGVAKPDPRIFERVLSELSVEPSEAVHIGDSEDDVNGAKAAGVEPVLFDPYKGNPRALQDLRGLIGIVEGQGSRVES
ncbi:MAG: hydrolase [Meiothermus sp.]